MCSFLIPGKGHMMHRTWPRDSPRRP